MLNQIRSHDILKKWLTLGDRQQSHPPHSSPDATADHTPPDHELLAPRPEAETRQAVSSEGSGTEQGNYVRPAQRLPDKMEAAKFLSCLEGYSHRDIADMAGAHDYEIESLLNRGRELLRDEQFGFPPGRND